MGMSLPEMQAFCQADPASRKTQSLPGAHLPNKGFWILKRPSGPSTAAGMKCNRAQSINKSINQSISQSINQSISFYCLEDPTGGHTDDVKRNSFCSNYIHEL